MTRHSTAFSVSALYQAAGLRDVAEWDVAVELVTRSPAQYWEMISEHASLAVAALARVGGPARERIAKAVTARASTYENDGKVSIPGLARCVVGTKPRAPGGLTRAAEIWEAGTSPRFAASMPGVSPLNGNFPESPQKDRTR